MARNSTIVMSFALAICPTITLAGTAESALSAVPEDALAFICIPDIAELDKDYQRAIKTMALDSLVQPPFNSLLGTLEQFLPMFKDIDTSGSMVLAFMPTPNVFDLQNRQVLMIPTKDPRAMLEAMDGKPGDGGIWSLNLMGQPMHAMTMDKQVVLGATPSLIKEVKAGKQGIAAKLQSIERDALSDLDFMLWVDADRLFAMIKPMVTGMLGPMMSMQAQSGGFEGRQAEANMRQLEMFMSDSSSFLFGLALDESGIALRGTIRSKEGSKLAEAFSQRLTKEPLLNGLPNSQYLLAFGQTADPKAVNASLEDLDVWFKVSDDAEDAAQSKQAKVMGELKENIKSMARLLEASLGTVSLLPGGSDGMFGVTLILETKDSTAALASWSKAVEAAMLLLADEAKNDEDMSEFHAALTFKNDGERLGDVNVQHLKVSLDEFSELEEEDVEDIESIVGKDGLLLRIAPASAKKIVITFGGGTARLGQVMEQVNANDTGLAKDAGIQAAAKKLPRERASVFYLSLERILTAVLNVQKAMDEESLPIRVPSITAPMAMSSSGAPGLVRFDMYMPNEVLLGTASVIRQLTGTEADNNAAGNTGNDES